MDDVGKGLKRVIAGRIKSFAERRPISSDRQFGFREGRSTIDAILMARNYIEEANAEGNVVLTVSLDIKNAFNSIPWGVIMKALEDKKFPKYIE